MRTIQGVEDLICGIIISENKAPRSSAKKIIEVLTEEENLNIPPIDNTEMLTAYSHHLKKVMCGNQTWSIESAIESFKYPSLNKKT